MKTNTPSMCQSFRQLLRGEQPAGVVWTADLTYWMAGQQQAGTDDPAWADEEGYLAFHRELGLLPYYYYPKFMACGIQDDATVTHHYTQQGQTSVHRISTPHGELSEVSAYMPESCSTGVVKHFVETEGDLDALRYLIERRRLLPANLEDYAERQVLWERYDGLPSLGLPRSPLASLLVEWAGVENGTYLLIDNEETVQEVLAMMEANEAPILDAVCALHPPLIHFPDNLSSENVGGLYDCWMAPTHRRQLERLHAAGIAAAVHLDGTIRGLLPQLVAVGFDAVEALTPAPVGDVSLAEMRRVAGSDALILWGGVPGAMFAPPYSWDDMEAHLRQLLEHWGGAPFIIGVADQVPPDGDITFCRRITELLREKFN